MSDPRRTETVGPDTAGATSRSRRKSSSGVEFLARGTELAKRFEVRGVLGSGGYAVVYRAFDRSLDREVALKVLRPDRLSKSSLKRLRREAAIARDMAHPRLTRIFDLEESPEAVFLTMEIVEGGSLADRLAAGGFVTIDQAVAWATQALEGLAALHELGILHRDIKPGNLLLTDEGEIQLTDFGLALHLEGGESRATTHESVLGTLEYLSPEQALGQPVDARSDLYSLGVVLYEVVAGRLPFAATSSLGSLLERLKNSSLPGLREARPDTPPWLAATIERLMARRPEDRYPSASAALAELGSRRARRRRRPLLRLVAVAALVAFAFGVAATLRFGQSRFSRIVPAGTSGVKAIDRSGRTLWSREAVVPEGNFAPLRTHRLGTVVAAVLSSPGSTLGRGRNVLDLLDPQTGGSLERVELPPAPELFPGFSDSFGAWIEVLDLDADGADELIVSFSHIPFYPSYNVLVEPDGQRARAIFASAGHHTFGAATDLDGDGRRELLFSGVNNRMGWTLGVAAVRVVPWIGEPDPLRLTRQVAMAPDLIAGGQVDSPLLWYSLVPGNRQHARGAHIRADPVARELLYHPDAGEPIRLDFSGFLTGSESDVPAQERESARRIAFQQMREGQRLLHSERPAEAIAPFDAAIAAAARAGDSTLREWLERLSARSLVLAGQLPEGLALYDTLRARSEAASEIAFEAARALHSRGDLESAIDWYRRALGRGASPSAGRNKFEVAQGLLFCLIEAGRAAEAKVEAARFELAFPIQPVTAERAFIAWRSGDPLPDVVPEEHRGHQDLHRYWWLEVRRERGESATALLDRIAAARPILSEYQPLYDGLEAELRARIDPAEDAIPLARRALEEARRLAATEPNYRVHLPILEERLRRLERALSGPPPSTSPPRSGG